MDPMRALWAVQLDAPGRMEFRETHQVSFGMYVQLAANIYPVESVASLHSTSQAAEAGSHHSEPGSQVSHFHTNAVCSADMLCL